jgi:hypothetical protein
MSRYLVDNGKEFKLVKTFRHEQKALDFCEQLEQGNESRRFKPILKRMHWFFASNSRLSRFIHFTRWKVYIPTGKEID